MNKNTRRQYWTEFFSDLICLIIANLISYAFFRFGIKRIIDYPILDWIRYIAISILAFSTIFIAFHKSIDLHKRSKIREFYNVLTNNALTYMFIIASLALFKNAILDSRYLLVSSFTLWIVLSSASRYFVKRILTGFYTKSKIASIAGIVTTSDIADSYIPELQKDWSIKLSGIALLDEQFEASNGGVAVKAKTEYCDVPVVANSETFMDWIRSSPLDEVIINLPYTDIKQIQDIVEELEDMGITVHINIPMLDEMLDSSKFNNINCRIYAGYPTATFSASIYNEKWLVVKRMFDIIFGVIGCILSIPIIAIIAIPLLIESPGSLIFKQPRVGRNGRIFNCYKLRSMYKDAEARKAELMKNNEMQGFMFKMEDDPRITKVGKFIRKYSIDELPQFFNVLKGDMSLIGTRPPTVDEFNQYESRHKRRLSMRPGITGMWQVSGRSEITDFEEVVKLDCKYIDEWSPMLDIKIFFKTILVIITHKGAE